MCVYIYADAYPHRHTMGLEIRIVTEIETMYLPPLYHLYTSSFVSSTVHVEKSFASPTDNEEGMNGKAGLSGGRDRRVERDGLILTREGMKIVHEITTGEALI